MYHKRFTLRYRTQETLISLTKTKYKTTKKLLQGLLLVRIEYCNLFKVQSQTLSFAFFGILEKVVLTLLVKKDNYLKSYGTCISDGTQKLMLRKRITVIKSESGFQKTFGQLVFGSFDCNLFLLHT